VLPEESVEILYNEELNQYSKEHLDSLKLQNWYKSIYDLTIEVQLKNGKQKEFSFFLSPNGDLYLRRDY
jgi:hypothetical protein